MADRRPRPTPGAVWTKRTLVVAAAGAVAVSGVVALTRDGGDTTDPRSGSVLAAQAPAAPLAPTTTPSEVVIEYRIEVGPEDDQLVTVDRLTLQRPFGSRLEAFDGAEVSDRAETVSASSFGRQSAEGSRAAQSVVLAVPPAPGVADVRIGAGLADAVDAGVVERRERRTVADRPCDVYRSRLPLSASDLLPSDGDDEYTDTCIDAAGLVLEELSVAGGARIIRRVAVDVDVDPALDPIELGDPTLGTTEGGGYLAELAPGSRAPGPFYEPSGPPSGFRLDGRYAVIPPQAANFTEDDRRASRRTFVSDVFVDGVDLIVFDQGATLGGVEPFPDFGGIPVVVDGFDDSRVSFGQSGPLVLVSLGDGRFLRARGTTDVAVLVELLESLTLVEGGELELLDG